MTDFNNQSEVIDSRDVIARIEELTAERDEYVSGAPDGTETPAPELWAEDNPELARELDSLEKLASQGEDYAPDWEHGETLIHNDYFTAYCEELVKDTADLPKGIPPYIVIDWQATADNLRVDYTEIDFDGEAYLVR